MDLDPFTKKLLERTEARRECLDKMEANMPLGVQRKRRSPMAEIVNFSSNKEEHDEPAAKYSEKYSPKRPCKDDKDKDLPCNKENSSNSQEENNDPAISKVNTPQRNKESQFLKRKSPNEDEEYGPQLRKQICCEENLKEDTTTTSQTRMGCKKRLAALANQINQWEDETSQFPSGSYVNKSTNSSKPLTDVATCWPRFNQTNKDPLKKEISTAAKDNSKSTEVISTKNCVSNSDPREDKLSTSQNREAAVPVSVAATTESKPSPKKTVLQNEQQVRKVQIWDSAILATLESQGFTKSPSASKLQFEYNNKSQISKSQKLESISEHAESSTVTDSTSPVLKETKSVSFKEQETKEEAIAARKKQVDPAELPLSARRALFEKAFCGGNVKNILPDKVETLSVAEKAALFEKGSSGKKSNPIKVAPSATVPRKETYAKVPQTEKLPQVAAGNQPPTVSSNSLSSEPLYSPNKAGNHTHQVQQQLFKEVNNRWQSNEICMKNKLERKQEMAVLLSHWENASSTSSSAAPKVLSDDHRKGLPNSSAFSSGHPCKTNIQVASVIEAPENNSESYEEESNESYEEESENWEDENASSMYEAENINKEAAAVCDEIDDLLDCALEDDADISNESENDANIAVEPVTKSSYQEESRVVKSSTVQQSSNPSRNLPVTLIDGEKEVPLLHTVSMYRKQKQEFQLTPIKKIIRRQQVQSPPSPGDDEKIVLLQQKLKALQEEVVAQQTIVSQTSQALNLCHATTEFCDSTEQVEAERLLLVATQKRQAYLNEIHRLKTDKVLGINGENGTGTLTLSDIYLGVKREFITARSEGKLENSVHYFICLVRCGAQLIATQMLSTEDRITENSLNFTNHITVQELQSDFSLSFEVYSLQARKQAISHDKKYHIRKDISKLRLTPKCKKSDSKLISPAVSSPGGPNAVRTSNFSLIGFTRLTLQNINRRSFILEKVPYVSPLDGTLSMRIQLHAKHDIVEKGFLTMFEDVSGFGAWHRRWCILRGNYLAYWKYPEDDKKKDPIGTIDLRQCVTASVKLVSRDVCARPHTLQLVTIRKQEKGDKDSLICQCKDTVVTTKHLISADTKEERIHWCSRLNCVLSSIRKWDPDAMQPTVQ